jgi:hypothetical protein
MPYPKQGCVKDLIYDITQLYIYCNHMIYFRNPLEDVDGVLYLVGEGGF